jgi:hypothetical protein
LGHAVRDTLPPGTPVGPGASGHGKAGGRRSAARSGARHGAAARRSLGGQHRDRRRSNSFENLLRFSGYPGFVIPSRRDDCICSTRYNRCLTIVIDGVPLSGSSPNINPRDIYSFALLGKTEATVQFGDRAPWGAIVIYTRAKGDR